MDGWMNGRTDGWTDRWMDGRGLILLCKSTFVEFSPLDDTTFNSTQKPRRYRGSYSIHVQENALVF